MLILAPAARSAAGWQSDHRNVYDAFERARQLCRAVHSAGGAFLECPVGGTVKPALDGALVGMAAGDRTTFDGFAHCLMKRHSVLIFSVMWAMRPP